jgi:hypothetical protein
MAMGLGMIQALNNLTQVMTQVFMWVVANNDAQITYVTTTEKKITNSEDDAKD